MARYSIVVSGCRLFFEKIIESGVSITVGLPNMVFFGVSLAIPWEEFLDHGVRQQH